VAVFQPESTALAAWERKTLSFVMMLAIASLVVLALAMAYFWQAWRARRTDLIFAKVRDRLDTALHRGRCGLWDWDIARGTIYWSDSMYDMLGYERKGEVLSFGDVNSLVHPDDGNLFQLADQLAAAKISTVDQAFRIRAADGSWIWVRTRAEVIYDAESTSPHLIGITVDITEQRRADAVNATADLRLRDAIETIGEAFVLWDADNKLVLCNSKFQDLHNLPPDMVRIGTPYSDLKNYLAEHLVHHRVDENDDVQSYETRLPNGRWLQINERPTRDGGYVSVGTDITTLKNQEELYIESERKLTAMVSDLRRSRLTLEEQTKQLTTLVERYLEQKAEAESANLAKSEFLARMSHELRTPLNAILGFSEMMENEIFGALGSPKYVDYCRDISRSGKSLLSIIADILDMSQIEAGRIRIDKRPLILNDVVEASVNQIRNEADAKNIRISTDLTADSNLVADKRSIARILSHLLHNAVKYTPDGGRITVRTREVSGAINLFVEDTGRGIPKEILPNIGKPFAWVGLDPTKPADGSGLGLALSKSFAELHGGTLSVRSTEGTGTTVLVRLPIRESPIEVAA
jgi:two-component system cell cycle sensor histidine kinase PleC